MACGTPAVTTDVGDAAGIVGDTGWVVPPKSPEALAGAIAEAWDERSRPGAAGWEERRRRSRRRIEAGFTLETMAARYRAVWEEAVGDAREAA